MKLLLAYHNWRRVLRQLIVLFSPLILCILEIWHPVGVHNKSAFESILPKVDWWLTLHLLQLPLFGLLALSILLIVDKLQGWPANICRIGMGFFLVFYTALDSITGIAGGVLIRTARNSPPNVQAFVAKQVDFFFFDPIVGGSTLSLIGLLGAGGWVVGVTAAAIALSKVGIDRLTTSLLILGGVMFGISHTPPTGPLGLFLIFFAVTRIDPRE